MSEISDNTLMMLRNAYVDFEIEADNPRWLADQLARHVETVLDEAGLLGPAKESIAKNLDKHP